MSAYPKTLHDVPDAGLAELLVEHGWLEQCSGLERELITRWLAARDTIEWLQAEQVATLNRSTFGFGEAGLAAPLAVFWPPFTAS